MQINYPNACEIFIFIWFAVSVLVAVVGNFVLWIWLRKLGVRLIFGLTGIPGYMERAYIEWCRSQGKRPSTVVLVFRAVSIINVVIAGMFFILIAAR